MKIRRLFLPAAVLLAAIGIGLAQLELPAPKSPPLADDNVSSLVTGEFSGNTHVDAVVLANGKPVLRESVETYQTYLQSSLTAVDIARMKGTGADGRDQLVAVGPGGLTLLEIVPVAPGSDPWFPSNLRAPGTYWSSAIAVRTGQVDGLYGDDIVAVTPTRVVIALAASGGGWPTDVSFVAGINITGVELVDWDGTTGGALELAVMIGANVNGPARIRIAKPNGTLVYTVYSSADSLIGTPLSTEDGPRWLAVVSTIASTGAQDLAVLSQTTVAGPWSLGAAGVHDLVAADWDGDLDDDLVLATNTTRDAWLYKLFLDGPMQLAIDTVWTPIHSPILLPVGHPNRDVSVQDGRMDVADVDHDGDVDLVSAVQGQYQNTTWTYADSRFSTVSVTTNDHNDEHDYLPWNPPGTSWTVGVPEPSMSLESGLLTVPLVRPNQVLESEGLVTVFEYGVWRTLSIDSLAVPAPILMGTLEIAPPDPEPDPTPGVPPYSTLTLPLNQHEPLFADRYTLIVRQVIRDYDDEIVLESPALIVTFFSNFSRDEFLIDWNNETTLALSIEFPPEIGGGVAGPSLPPTPPNQNP